MKIFLSHSSNFNYEDELYKPIRESSLNSIHEFFLPHEGDKPAETRDIIKGCDLMLADVSYPSTGQGIELGWASLLDTAVVCMYKEGAVISDSLRHITDRFVIYKDTEDLIRQLTGIL